MVWSAARGLVGTACVIAGLAGMSRPVDAQPLALVPVVEASRGIDVTLPGDGSYDDADDQRWHVSRCLLGLSYGSPLKLSVAVAGGLRRAFESRTVCSYGAVHLGLGGTRASLGTAVTFGRYGSAVGVSGGALRTFGNPAGSALPQRTYVGGSVHVWPLLAVHTEVGAYSLVTRSGEAGQRIVVWSVGFGY